MSGTHEKFSPSRHPMLSYCPGWKSSEESGPAAERGTRIHAIIEDFLSKSDKGLVFSEDEMLAASRAIGWFQDVILVEHPGITFMFEKYVPGLLPDTGGTLDVVGVDDFDANGQIVVAIDWKSGSKSYDAETNQQGHVHVINTANFYGAKAVIFYFFNCDSGESSRRTFHGDDFARLRMDAEERIVMAEAAERTGYGLKRFYGCNWCGRKLTCQEYRKDIDHAVGLPILNIAALSPDDLGAALDRYTEPAQKIAEFYKSLRARAIEVGATGYTVGSKAGPRQWKDADAARLCSENAEVGLKDWVSPAEAERRIKKAGIDTAMLANYTVQPPHKTLTKDKE